MSSNCEAIRLGHRSGLLDRTSSATVGRGSIGLVFVPRVDHASAWVSTQFGFSTRLSL